jgi:hypothetical protein
VERRVGFPVHRIVVRGLLSGPLLIVRRHGLTLLVEVGRLPLHGFRGRLGEPRDVGAVHHDPGRLFCPFCSIPGLKSLRFWNGQQERVLHDLPRSRTDSVMASKRSTRRVVSRVV